jgi:thiamine pyrophosphate-dependent acetolactate synthase large subunit-like protein
VHAFPAGQLVVLAGPGVVQAGCVEGLRAFAAAGELGVANTWGAKGVFPWDSPHHLGTCGLQARDFELLGFGGYDAIVATGIDPDESPYERFALGPVIELAPAELEAAAADIEPRRGTVPPNDLYPRLSAIAQPGYVDERVPLHPARAVADVRAVLPSGGLVIADPGLAGLWVARTFPTTELGSVAVPARRKPGVAATLAVDAARTGRAAIAVTTAPVDDATIAELERARAEGLPVVLEVWGDGHLDDVSAHRAALEDALAVGTTTSLPVPVDLGLTELLVEAAGPVVAWTDSRA